jgi:hypothetical protein
MDALSQAFEARLHEIEAYLDLLEALERQIQTGPPEIGGSKITSLQQKILYSGVYLHLYNLVEATVTWCVEAVCIAATANSHWRPGDLSANLRREWVRSIARTHVDLNHENRLDAAVLLCDALVQAHPLSELKVEKKSNWDDVDIMMIMERLGCNLQIDTTIYNGIKRPIRDDKGALALIKHLRNNLAHGSLAFSECGDGVTVPDLKDLKQRIALYLREVVAAVRAYIDAYEFLLPQRRPVASNQP